MDVAFLWLLALYQGVSVFVCLLLALQADLGNVTIHTSCTFHTVRCIKLDNAMIRGKVAALPGSLELLQLAGFALRDG